MGKPGLICVIVGAITVSACTSANRASTDSTTSAPTRVTTTTVHPRPTTTTSTPDFSFDDSVPPPKLVNTGKDYVAILKSLEAYGNWAASHRPEPALIGRFVAAGAPLSTAYLKTLTILRDKSQRFVEHLGGPDEIKIISTSSDAFSATIVQRITSRKVVGSSGNVIREARFTGTTTYLALVVRLGEHWYLASTDVTRAPTLLS